MTDWTKLLTTPTFVLFAWLTITSVVSSVGYYWYKLRKTEIDAGLKHAMIERGMSADEIKQVLEATGSGRLSREGQTAQASAEAAGTPT